MIHGSVRFSSPVFLAAVALGLAIGQPLRAQANRSVPAPVRGYHHAGSSSARIDDESWLTAEADTTADPDGWAEPAPLGDPAPAAEFDPLVEQPSEELDWLDKMSQLEERLDDLEAYRSDHEKAAEKAAKAESDKKKGWYEKLAIRGYAQIRLNEVVHEADGSFPAHLVGDSSVGEDQSFIIRRARVIISGDVHEHLGVYLQPDFASSVQGAGEGNQFVQIRDWYGDVYLDTAKVHRLRIGQSKIPYGWENLQSSSNRLPLDRNDSLNSAARNERDLGVFYYWTPEPAQQFFKYVIDEGLKGSGNYGVFGLGFYNGQGGSLRERNDNVHTIARLALPGCLPNGQRYEVAMQGYTGKYVPTVAAISPLGVGPAVLPTFDANGIRDERLAWTLVYYPQPLGFQAEWTVGNGPGLNDAQTAIEERSLQGGYVQTMYRIENDHGIWFPFARYSHFEGGYKSERNSPEATINEWELGLEWQFNSAMELVSMYTITDRTNTVANSQADTLSYGQFEGNLMRFQFQFNY